MNINIDYLLKYISNETYTRVLNNKPNYLLKLLEDNQRDVCLNIEHLIKYGINNINYVVYERLEELVVSHNEFITYIKEYEKTLDKASIIKILENV